MTGPVQRFARQIAGHGYIVAAPSSYHEFTGPEPIAYDVPGTDAGNSWKVEKVEVPHTITPFPIFYIPLFLVAFWFFFSLSKFSNSFSL